MFVRVVVVLIVATSLAVSREVAFAGKFNAAISIKGTAPEFNDLSGVDGKSHSSADYREAKLLVIVFTCCHSPCATAYEQRLVTLDNDYRDRGVQLVAVSVSRSAADDLSKMKERAAKAGFAFPYVQDISQQLGRKFGATTTPQIFVLDVDRRVRYMGRIDDQLDEVDVQKPYVRQALDALLDGRDPPTPETRPDGCRIQYKPPVP